MPKRWLRAVGLALVTASCRSVEFAGPAFSDVQGEWTMSWTESGTGLTCTWSGVSLSLHESSRGPTGSWGEGEGACSGLIDSDNLRLFRFVVDSLTVEDGRIRFKPRETSYHFEGRVTGDRMGGNIWANLFHAAIGAEVPTSGRWQAVRVSAPE